MTDQDYPDWGFGDMVTANINRGGESHKVEGEVVATGPDNQDLDDDQYIIALGGDAHYNDALSQSEIIRRSDVVDWREP